MGRRKYLQMGIFSNTWQAITGKLPDYNVWGRNQTAFSSTDKTIDYTRNDYDLYRSLYYNVSINGKAKDMLGGAAFVSPIINTTVGFALGLGYTAVLQNEKYFDVENDINTWLRKNETIIYNTIKHGFRDGDAYFYIDEFGNLDELDPATVTVVTEPVSGDVIGYNVLETYDLAKNSSQKDQRTILKEYRKNSTRYTEFKTSEFKTDSAKGNVLFYQVYTTNGTVTPTENQMFYEEELVDRPLPIIHFAHEQEPRQVYGNSELLKLLVGLRNYSAVLSNATKGVIYNSNPIPYMSGVKDSSQVARQSNSGESEDVDKVNWSPDSIIFLENPESSAGYIQANGFMADAGQLLEYYFYLMIEASETPEFVFGTAVASSKASVSEQMPIVIQKATRNRNNISNCLQALIIAYIDKKIRLSDTLFLPLKKNLPEVTISYPDIIDEDRNLTLETVKYLLDSGLLSDKTALSVLMGSKIDEVDKELEQAKKDTDTKIEKSNVMPEQPDRLQDEIDANKEENNEK